MGVLGYLCRCSVVIIEGEVSLITGKVSSVAKIGLNKERGGGDGPSGPSLY